MTLLATREELGTRAAIVSTALGELQASLSGDLLDVMRRELHPPDRKAKLTRKGGRCSDDGAMLDFNPFSPYEHECPRCARIYTDEEHYLWWMMSYQLFLAERAVQGALLFNFTGEARFADFSEELLQLFANHYGQYPNSDNVLGPSRPFFSTYLESIWLLQICVALDFLELRERAAGIGKSIRETLIAPSAELIASYDEGGSNRQAWNSAALLAAASVMHDKADFKKHAARAHQLMQQSLLADGSWYEGENYHLFAHRGLWYIVEMCSVAGHKLSKEVLQRYDRGFVTPFRTALPDMTLLARRDSQHSIALRQWRFAELCELGIAAASERNGGAPADLIAVLRELYATSVVREHTGRDRSTAEVERNMPPTKLTRADLGWKSLLRALPSIPETGSAAGGGMQSSTLLESQGIAVFRRQSGRVMVSLDYGHHGGGHGHPDRLNLNFHVGHARWLDDPGTGSYVDSSLFWYRSSLAHTAPMSGWRTQSREHGVLHGYHEEPDHLAGWVEGGFDDSAASISYRRSLIVLDRYFIDDLNWSSQTAATVQLPIHLAPDLIEVVHQNPVGTGGERSGEQSASRLSFSAGKPNEPQGDDPGLVFVTERSSASVPAGSLLRISSRIGKENLVSWVFVPLNARLWRMRGPGAPTQPTREFLVVDFDGGSAGRCVAVHDWSNSVSGMVLDGDSLRVTLRSGVTHFVRSYPTGLQLLSSSPDEIPRGFSRRWSSSSESQMSAPPGFVVTRDVFVQSIPASGEALSMKEVLTDERALVFELGEMQYRRSELDYAEHGKPVATVRMVADPGSLLIGVDVRKSPVHFAAPRQEPYLDNEHPDINSDGIQLHLANPESPGAGDAAFIFVPQGSSLRVISRAPRWKSALLESGWKMTPAGYCVIMRIDRSQLPGHGSDPFLAEVIVNLMASGRERRSGQLTMGNSSGEWIYLQGDRQGVDKLLPMRIADD